MIIGPTFGEELRAAGLNDGVGWNPDTGEVYCPDEMRAAVEALLAQHDPKDQPPVEKTDVEKLAALLVSKNQITAQEADAVVAK